MERADEIVADDAAALAEMGPEMGAVGGERPGRAVLAPEQHDLAAEDERRLDLADGEIVGEHRAMPDVGEGRERRAAPWAHPGAGAVDLFEARRRIAAQDRHDLRQTCLRRAHSDSPALNEPSGRRRW